MAKACAFVLHRLCEAQKHLLTVIGGDRQVPDGSAVPGTEGESAGDSGGGLQYR